MDRVKIINKVQTESKGIRPIKYNRGNDLSRYLYLKDVVYIVTAHFEFNHNRPELKEDHNENKHYFIAKRSLERGGRRDVFLGVRECQAYAEPANFNNEESYYKDMGEMMFGMQYHSLSYPDENGKNQLLTRFWYPKMVDGVINFCRPEKCPKEVKIRKMDSKEFGEGNYSGLKERQLLEGYNEEVVQHELDNNPR